MGSEDVMAHLESRPFDKVLVANRGEIAIRIIRSCKALGYRTVAVYSDADRDAPHVAAADEAVHLGPPAARESYLVIDKILAAAKASGAGAIHPGYGFLAENEDFARACEATGVVFIGPAVAAIELMGNKRQAKLRMIEAGVPCVPGYEGADQSDDVLVREAGRIGLPVMVKAAAGGGGRGMRLVTEAAALLPAIHSARSEAENAFGSGELILERAVIGARHVEIQVFADRHGHVIHLGERDCSVQRRHQKVVEESPSPAVDAALRARMGAVAVAAARAIDYVGAGTIEFLLGMGGEFYFMEMNTRLQVEHPVTELVTGLDLVALQLAVAAGEPLPLAQEDVRFSGHAIEVRLCAEDAAAGYLPQTGQLLAWRVPEGDGVRVDHGVRAGQVISPYYDSMLAKVIAHGPTRDAARRRLQRALSDTTLLGLVSNRDLLGHILGDGAFCRGVYDTGFLPARFPDSRLRELLAPSPLEVAVAAAVLFHTDALALRAATGLDETLTSWNSAFDHPFALRLARGDTVHETSVRPRGAGRYEVTLGGETRDISFGTMGEDALPYVCGEVQGKARFARDGERLWLDAAGATHVFEDATLRPPRAAAGGGDGRVLAPMDGKILAVKAAPGEAVKRGQTLLVLEAMKMEMQVVADVDGTIAEVGASVGAQVRARQVLMVVTPAG